MERQSPAANVKQHGLRSFFLTVSSQTTQGPCASQRVTEDSAREVTYSYLDVKPTLLSFTGAERGCTQNVESLRCAPPSASRTAWRGMTKYETWKRCCSAGRRRLSDSGETARAPVRQPQIATSGRRFGNLHSFAPGHRGGNLDQCLGHRLGNLNQSECY